MLKRIAALLLPALFLAASCAAVARAETPFRFEGFYSLDTMRAYIEKTFPLGTPREDMRKAFVEQGKATLKQNPVRPAVEKYLYDIDLCGKYVFRWNISADFDDAGKLAQAYVNGRFVFMTGLTPRTLKVFEASSKLKRVVVDRPRPEMKGTRKYIRYRMYDTDGDMGTLDDRMAEGEGPAEADPFAMQKIVFYRDVELWRSIFDPDDADKVVPYTPCSVQPPRDPLYDVLLGPEVEKMKADYEKAKETIKGLQPAP